MKKGNIVNLIKYYAEENDSAFRTEAYEIAKNFYEKGDIQLAEYIMSLLANNNLYVPQIYEEKTHFLKKHFFKKSNLTFSEEIKFDIEGIINATNKKIGVNKFLFIGSPGTGKTESVTYIARVLQKNLFVVNFSQIIDSKLGQTAKNIFNLFEEINNLNNPDKAIILFDEIDALALDRINSNDVREMGRATSEFLKGLDNLNEKVTIIATTNLSDKLDRALTRRFDTIINFNRYSKEDLLKIAENILNSYILKIKNISKNTKLFKKIILLSENIPFPGELKNIIKTSLAFSDISISLDYLKRLYKTITNETVINIKTLKEQGFSIRESEILTNTSKSKISRDLKDNFLNEQ
ncbi:ATP-binding protein [[Mycoplasma] collis]|uniref:ATP-binding protein n=1 Tax=[Mycoplasma] collis TaxID=2127 RepID=UPI00051AD919|nr:ATP-binding protein [[Mycoplasma] collis]